MRGTQVLFQYRRKVWRIGAGTVKKGCKAGYCGNLSAAWAGIKRKPGLLYRTV